MTKRVKITDKERISFLQSHALGVHWSKYVDHKTPWHVDYALKRHRTLRQAIDAAIRAERKAKPTEESGR